jgi:hypothetical protein
MPFPILEGEKLLQTKLQFALILRDGFADSENLLGNVEVTAGGIKGERKESSGIFLFYSLKQGANVLQIRSSEDTPYYLARSVDVAIPLPSAVWPAFPDITVADPNLPLGDPGQKPVYKSQRAEATLLPTPSYPFPEGTTLIRGVVRYAGQLLADATVQQAGSSAPAYKTGKDGQFVIFIENAPSIPRSMVLNAKHAGFPDANPSVTVMRGLTVSVTIDM